MADEGTGFYLPRDTHNKFQADQFEQQARGQVADAWEQQARAAAPDLAAYHEQQVAQDQQRQQERASYQASQDSAAQAGFQQAQQEAAQQEAAQQQQQQAQQNEQAAQQFGAQAWDQAATAATGVAPVRAPVPAATPTPQAAPAAPSVTTSTSSAPAPAPAPTPAPVSAAPMPSASSGNYVAYAWQAAQKAGFDPATFVKQIQQESGFQPFNADGTPKRSGAGAIGIAQFMPGTAQGLGIDPTNPLAALDAAAKLMAGYVQKYGGDTAKALAAYNAGPGNVDKFGGVPPFAETQTYVKNILGDAAGLGQQLTDRAKQGLGDIGQAAQDAGAGAARVVTSAVNNVIENLRPSQFGVGLDNASAYAACGPVAALAFARAVGRNPTIAEAMQLAKGVGWSAAQGMAGPASELSLLKGLGVTSHMEQGADPNKIAQDVQNGNPVIISTPGHYFVADGYDAQRGAFHVGTSGTDLRAGSEWMTLGQMQQVMGQAQATLYLDRQPGDGPSVAAQQTAQSSTGPLTMGVMQPGDQQAAAVAQPASPGGFNPFDAVKNLAGSVGSGISTLFGGGGQQTPTLLGGIGASGQTPSALSLPGAAPANANLEAFGTQPPSQVLPFGGRTAADLITEPLKMLGQTAPAQAAGQALSDLYANPLRQELMPNITEPGHPANVMADLQDKYASNSILPPNPADMTPEDQQRYSQAQLAVGGMASPTGATAGVNDYLRALRVGSLAGGIPTLSHIAINTPVQAGLKLLGDVPKAIVTGRMETIPAEFVGMWKGLETWSQNASQVLGHQGAIGQSLGGGAVGQAVESGLLGLVKTHPVLQDAARQIGTGMEMWRQAAQEATNGGLKPLTNAWQAEVQRLVANPTSDMVDAAQRVGDRFALGGPLGTQGQKMADYLKDNPIGQFIAPFFNIGYHVASQGIETSPAGLLGTGYDVLRAGFGKGPYAGAQGFAGTGGANAVTPVAERLRNNMIGLGLSIGAYNLAAQGLITGEGPEDPDKRQELVDRGWMPDAIKIGDRYFDAHVLGPLGTALVGAANLYEAREGDVKPGASGMDQFTNFLAREGQYFENETFLKSFGQVLQALGSAKDSGRMGAQEVTSVLQSLIPQGALIGNIASATDPLSRKPVRGDYGQALEQKFPGLRQQTPERLTRSGEPVPNPQSGLGILLPRNSQIRPDPMLDLFGNAGIALSAAPKTVPLGNGRAVSLQPEDQQTFLEARGQVLHQMTTGLVNDAQFQDAPIAARKKVLERLVQQADRVVAGQIISGLSQDDLMSRMQAVADLRAPQPLNTPLPLQASAQPSQIQPPRSLASMLPMTGDEQNLDPLQRQERQRRQLAGLP